MIHFVRRSRPCVLNPRPLLSRQHSFVLLVQSETLQSASNTLRLVFFINLDKEKSKQQKHEKLNLKKLGANHDAQANQHTHCKT
jgi:hypothetical protein